MSDESTLRLILAACERTATACERIAGSALAAQAPEQAATKPKGDILTVTSNVLHFDVFCDRAGNPRTTKKGNQYWQLKLASGFEAMVFSTTQAATCQKAFYEDRALIVDYVISGKYQNIEDIRLGPMATRHAPAVEDNDEVPF